MVRHDGRIVAVVEAATEELPVEQPVAVNCGAMALRADWAWDQLDSIPPDSITGELYLTDLVRLAAQSGATDRRGPIVRSDGGNRLR